MTQLIIFLPEKSTLIRKIIVIFMLLVGGAQQGFAQPDCPSILFTLIDQDPCCYQLNLENLSDCTPELRILLDVGQFTSFVADVGNGFTVTSVTQTELLLTHSSGIIPFGTSAPLEFCIEPGTTPIFTILYDITCGLGQSCFYEVALAGCAAQDTCMAEFTFPADFCGQIQFVNTSTGPAPLSFTWDFGDPGSIPNNTSVLKDPWHKFTACGQYNVCLTINGGMCNSTVCHLVNIVDNNPPVALCKNGVMIPLGANCQANVTSALIDDGSFDDCLIQSMSVSPNVITGCGSFPVVLTVTDWCGNTNSCTTDVQGVDNIPPIIFCPADLHLSTTGPNCSMIVQGIQPVLVDDNCGTPLLSYVVSGASSYAGNGSASGLSFDAGTSFVTYTATDNCGNIASCSFKIVVDCICHCQNNLIQNSGFDQGSIMGNLGFNLWPGHTNNWFRISETPHLDGTTFFHFWPDIPIKFLIVPRVISFIDSKPPIHQYLVFTTPTTVRIVRLWALVHKRLLQHGIHTQCHYGPLPKMPTSWSSLVLVMAAVGITIKVGLIIYVYRKYSTAAVRIRKPLMTIQVSL